MRKNRKSHKSPNPERAAAVLKLRAQGLSFSQIGARLGCTRQNVQLIEQSEMRRRGLRGSIADRHAIERATWAQHYAEKGACCDLTQHTGSGKRGTSKQIAWQSICQHADKAIDAILAALEAGHIAAAQAWDKILELQKRLT